MAKLSLFERRRRRVRTALKSRAGGKPRLSIHRTGKHIYAQVIDDTVGHTLCSASTHEAGFQDVDGHKVGAAHKVGELVAERAKALGIEAVVFDRGGNKYHGRVAAVAEGAREGGLAL